MKPTLAQLEAFYWVATLGSFHAAASRLNMSQPTISLRIRALEAGLGDHLLRREGRRVQLTTRGAALFSRAERIIAITDEIAGGQLSQDLFKGRLRLGATDSFALVCLPELLRALERRYPELQVALTVENSAVLAGLLNDHQLDIAFLSEPQLGGHVRMELLGAQHLAWICGSRLVFARRRITPIDLNPYQIITNPEPSKLIGLIRHWYVQSALEPVRISTCNSLSVIIPLVAAGAGVSLLPTSIVRSELRAGKLRRLETRSAIPPQRLFAAYPREAASPVTTALIETTRRILVRTAFLAR